IDSPKRVQKRRTGSAGSSGPGSKSRSRRRWPSWKIHTRAPKLPVIERKFTTTASKGSTAEPRRTKSTTRVTTTTKPTTIGARPRMKWLASTSVALWPPTSTRPSPTVLSARRVRTSLRASSLEAGAAGSTWAIATRPAREGRSARANSRGRKATGAAARWGDRARGTPRGRGPPAPHPDDPGERCPATAHVVERTDPVGGEGILRELGDHQDPCRRLAREAPAQRGRAQPRLGGGGEGSDVGGRGLQPGEGAGDDGQEGQ